MLVLYVITFKILKVKLTETYLRVLNENVIFRKEIKMCVPIAEGKLLYVYTSCVIIYKYINI